MENGYPIQFDFLFNSLYLPLYKSIFVWPAYATQRYKRYEKTLLLEGNDEFLNWIFYNGYLLSESRHLNWEKNYHLEDKFAMARAEPHLCCGMTRREPWTQGLSPQPASRKKIKCITLTFTPLPSLSTRTGCFTSLRSLGPAIQATVLYQSEIQPTVF